MEYLVKSSTDFFNIYVDSFSGLTTDQQKNFRIKKDHTFRVTENSRMLASSLDLSEEEVNIAVVSAIFHDIGRFRQLVDFNTFNDNESEDHAETAIGILKENNILQSLDEETQELIFLTIRLHNKLRLPSKLNSRQLLHSGLLRDADKLDILKVLTDYYSDRNQAPNHTLTWELPKATQVSPAVAKEILAGKMVSKNEVKSELDVKIMQFSWIYDINFKASIELIIKNRYMEKIYNTLPKNDMVIEIYRKIKVFAENKLME